MNTRIGVEPETDLDGHGMTGNVGLPTYEAEQTWNYDQFITAPNTKTNTPGPDDKKNMGLSKKTVKDEDATIRGGCCGKNFDVFSGETSFHGLKHISGENNNSRRIAWIIILVLAFCCLSYQINLSVLKFFEYPTNTKLNYVTKREISFPKVTVCNINMFRIDQVTAEIGGFTKFYEGGLNYLRSLAPEIGIISSNRTGNGNGGCVKLTNTTYLGGTNLQEFISHSGHKIKDMLEVCIFNGIECGPENFTLTYTNYGACYIFTPTTKSSLNNAGQKHGLSLILNVEHLQYVTAPRENLGFRIAIDSQHDAPDLEASGVDVGTGMRASIGLRKHTVRLFFPHKTQ
ncbi:acid-sensing ion channel 4-A-like [Anneissia japonica]|uniref:acid-sensing ion channel 4-A-like n=1 Tax=Anneissia japonica TaxID=1529436 RepID=UPI0014259621|nr:acid-sensing ion channel 4-A-like [Anneissia japonica]